MSVPVLQVRFKVPHKDLFQDYMENQHSAAEDNKYGQQKGNIDKLQ